MSAWLTDARMRESLSHRDTDANAIDFALDECSDAFALDFLEARRQGARLQDWPDYEAWLATHRPPVETTEPSRLRMWTSQITFTAAGVFLVEVVLAIFR